MYITNFKPGQRVRYMGNSQSLNRGSWYTIETNFIKNSGIFLKIKGTEAQFPSDHFEGEVMNLHFIAKNKK
jgi:hypothetical protein